MKPFPSHKAPQRRGMSAMLRRLAARRTAHALTALVLGAVVIPYAQAANTTLYWDADGSTTTATGGTGVWNLTSPLWRSGTATGALQNYDNTSPSAITADFGGTAGTVTIGSGLTINVNAITFETTGYTLAGTNSTSIINLSGTAPTITGSGTTNISAKITGTAGFTETGGNFTVFTGNLTGLTGTVNDNTRINLDGTTETGSQFQTWNVTGTLSSENHGTTSTIQLGALTGSGTLRIGNNGAGTIDSGTDTFQIGALNTSTTFSGTIVNHSAALTAITKVGTGTLTLSGANTYTGGTTINSGIGEFGKTQAMPASGTVTVASGATLALGVGGSGDFSTATSGTGSIGGVLSSATFASGSAIGLDTTDGATTYGGVIANAGANTLGLTKLGANTLILTGTNTYSGITIISGGTLQVSSNGTTATLGSGNIVDNAALVFNRANTMSVANLISGTGIVSQTGEGTLTLTGANTYTGGTTINSGTLTLGNTSALGATSGALNLNGGTVNPNGTRGATLDLNGNSTTAGALTSTDQSSYNGFNLGSSANTLTVSSANVSGTNYIGINNATSITSTGTYNLFKSGSAMTGGGTFTFSGAQDLTVPVNSIIAKNSSGNYYRMTLNNTGSAEQLVVTNTNLGNTINIMPLGASISFGTSATGTAKNGTVITSYNGSGYHSQLYQNLVNDGRFNPNFVGSNTATGAVNPSGASILSTVGQTASEGHPGYTNSQILGNLNSGGNWLSVGNGVNPNDILLNVGGNDFDSNSTDTNAILRYDAIVSQVNALRPGVATIVTSLMYRTDVGTSQDTLYNPYIPGIVYNHALAGQNVRYLDLYTLLTPGDSQSILGPDGVHPTQAGYDQEANALSESLLYGAAYYKGGQNGVWSNVNGTTTNFASDSNLTTDRQKSLTDASTRTYTGAYADVWFNNNATALSTTLGADTTIRSLNFASGAAGAVSVGGPNTLTIGAGGITVQQGTGAHTVSANVALGAAQTWGNVSSNTFTVSGVVSGSNNLSIAGAYTTYNPGSVSGGVYTPTASTYIGSGTIALAGDNTYTGSTTINQYGVLQIGNGGTSGSLSTGSAITDNGALIFNRSNTITQGTDFANVISGSGSVTQNGTGQLVLSGANTYTGATTINGGTLALGTGGSLSTASGIADGAMLAFTSTGSATVGNVISGAGAVTQSGTGTTTLTGANTYTGATNVSAGTLALNHTGSAAVVGSSVVVSGNASSYLATGTATSGVLSLGTTNQIQGATVNATPKTGGTGGTAVTLTGGTLEMNGNSQGTSNGTAVGATVTNFGAGTLTVDSTTNTSYLDFGAGQTVGGATEVFSFSGYDFGAGKLVIENYIGNPFSPTSLTAAAGGGQDQLFFGNGQYADQQLTNVYFENSQDSSSTSYTGLYQAHLLNTGQVVAPEPSQWVSFGLGILGLGGLALKARKRRAVNAA